MSKIAVNGSLKILSLLAKDCFLINLIMLKRLILMVFIVVM